MCDPGDERSDLSPEDALLWCMRLWAVAWRQPVAAQAQIAEIFVRLGAREAAACLGAFMATLRHGALRPIGLNCIRRPLVSADERALLDVLALTQHGRRFEALLRLRELVASEVGQAALAEAEEIGICLSRAGRFLATPEGGVQLFILPECGVLAPERT